MKKFLRILSIAIICIFLSVINVMAFHPSVLLNENFKQVTNKGRENNVNTIGQQDGVLVSKTIEETDIENYFDITLKVKTSNSVKEILKDQDLAIVIVMDISNTMNDKDVVSDNGTITRLEAAQNAAKDFIDEFVEYSQDVDASRKLGFVAFNTDAHEIFELQDCNTSDIGNILKDEMYNDTQKIAKATDYKISPTRFTNIEAGLLRAHDMLSGTDIKNKYIIFISDGLPTTYIESEYKGYNPYMSTVYNSSFVIKDSNDTINYGYTESSEGIFYNELINKLAKDGTSYSDEAARRAAEMAQLIENTGTKIFSIGISIDTGVSGRLDPNSYVTDVDIQKYEANGNKFEVGNTVEGYKNWLGNNIGSGFYYDVTSTDALKAAYAEIFSQVKKMSEQSSQGTWVAEDPMGQGKDSLNIEFVGLFDDTNLDINLQGSLIKGNENQTDTANFENGKISWDLKNSDYIQEFDDETGVTYYIYEIKYRVRLKNELEDFDVNTIYQTNGTTKLTYVIRTDGIISENKYIEFPIPEVVGYLGELTFIKKSTFDNTNLSDALFQLTHSKDCLCRNERVKAKDSDLIYTAKSNSDGTVIFMNIPSGHKYDLTEVKAPDNYILSTDTYSIEVAYGKVVGGPKDMIFNNNIKTTTLEIMKEVHGNKDESSEFSFLLEVEYNSKKITGNYYYKIIGNDNEKEGNINLEEGAIRLKDNEKIIIYGLPVNSVYTVTETNTDGYEVSYNLNSIGEKDGSVVVCNSTNSCYLKEKGDNTVTFINLVGYVLPETGSSSMLILTIIGALLFGTPVIYIGYLFYQNERSVNLLLKR